MRFTAITVVFAAALTVFAADLTFTSYASVQPILDAEYDRVPADLKTPIRSNGPLGANVRTGLFAIVSNKVISTPWSIFCSSPRVDDLVADLRSPGDNERLVFLSGLLRSKGINPEASGETGVFLYNNLRRVLQERRAIAERAAEAKPTSLLDRVSLFADRGVSLDTSILPDFSIEQTLRDLKKRGMLSGGQVVRVAIIGPGLDFIDKNEESGYDYYPPQTVQPFALYDSLLRLGLAKTNRLSVTVFDISQKVIDHLQRVRERARKNTGYVIQLPRDVARAWPPELVSYSNSLGDQVGTAVKPTRPPEIF